MEKILKPEDFSVEECVTHYFEKDDRWFWYCLTEHTGSGKRRKHLRGHMREGDVKVAIKYHTNAKRRVRQNRVWLAWYYKVIMTTKDLDYFLRLWAVRFPLPEQTDQEDLMARIQSDNYLWQYMLGLQHDKV